MEAISIYHMFFKLLRDEQVGKKTILITPGMTEFKLLEQGPKGAIGSETTQHRKIRSFEATKGQEHLGKTSFPAFRALKKTILPHPRTRSLPLSTVSED